MLSVQCWLCGQEVDLSHVNLMDSYERYLMLTFVLSLMMRFRQYQNNVRFAWQFPQQWPSVFEVIKQKTNIFLTWTTLLPVGITLTVLLTHTVCYRLIWSEAVVTPQELSNRWTVLWLLLPVSLLMVFLDLKTLFTASSMDFAEIERNLSRGEYALTSRTLRSLRVFSLGFFNPRKYIENRVTDSLHGVRLVLLAQLRRWSFHTAVRIAFGFLLWFGYALLNQHLQTKWFFAYAALIGGLLGAAFWWSQRPIEPPAPVEELPAG